SGRVRLLGRAPIATSRDERDLWKRPLGLTTVLVASPSGLSNSTIPARCERSRFKRGATPAVPVPFPRWSNGRFSPSQPDKAALLRPPENARRHAALAGGADVFGLR